MKRTGLFLNVISLFALSFFLYSLTSISAEKQDHLWSYTLINGAEKTERFYLLMHFPTFIKEISDTQGKRVYVKSTCVRGLATESSYGTCTHDIDIQPENIKFTLDTGENVVRIYVPPFNKGNNDMFAMEGGSEILILGTIEGGCCDSLSVVKYYSEAGKYLGKLSKRRASGSFDSGNQITRTYRQGNTVTYKGKIYMILDGEDKRGNYEALVFKNGSEPVRIPILFDIPDKDFCEDWNIDDFLYGIGRDGMGLFLKLEGQACNNNTGTLKQEFICSIDDKSITCVHQD